MAVILLNHQIMRDHIASIHRKGCRDIERDAMHHAAHPYEYPSVEAALADFIDAEMTEMGWTVEDVKVYSCTRKHTS
jgi:hypothetical protein